MKLLFVKNKLAWPRTSGHDVHGYYMMKACGELGHEVALATLVPPSPDATAGLTLARQQVLDPGTSVNGHSFAGTRLQQRFRSFWGVAPGTLAALENATATFQPHALIAVGLDVLPYLPPSSKGVVRVWYAADEWIWHHLSQLQMNLAAVREHLYGAAVKGVYERAHASVIDRAWVVSSTEGRAMRWLAGVGHVDIVPNGVDGDYFTPRTAKLTGAPGPPGGDTLAERTAVFWGRLDFGPNVQGLEWFCRRVWPHVVKAAPDARFTIVGSNPIPQVRTLTGGGISLVADVPDLRNLVKQHAVAVLPFISGGGIKNKLLEAAAMGLPIVATPTATLGLTGMSASALETAEGAEAFAARLIALWRDADQRQRLGDAARRWVVEHHTWRSAAVKAMRGIEESIGRAS